MSKEKNDLFVVILFSIIWIVRPISYDEMRSRHPIYPQENAVVVNSSSILTKSDELEFLEGNIEEIILAKDSNGSFFAEGFSLPFPQRPGGRTTTGMNGQNPGQGGGGGNSNPGSGSEAGSCSSNPTPKATPEVMNYGLGSPPKTKKQKALEKMKRELQESIQEEDKLNAQRKKQGKAGLTLIIKDGIRFFAPNDQLQ